MNNNFEIKGKLSKEDFLKLKGLQAIHDDLVSSQQDVWSSVASILDEVMEKKEDSSSITNIEDIATDSMFSEKSLEKLLDDKGIEIAEDGDS